MKVSLELFSPLTLTSRESSQSLKREHKSGLSPGLIKEMPFEPPLPGTLGKVTLLPLSCKPSLQAISWSCEDLSSLSLGGFCPGGHNKPLGILLPGSLLSMQGVPRSYL